MKFENQNILIVGASSGIGNALAQTLIQQGANVFSASRQKPDLNAVHYHYDVSNIQGNELDALPESLNGLVYCPGTINLKPFNRLSKEDFLNDFTVNVLGAVQTIQKVLNRLKKSENASIVLFSTVAAKIGMPFHASIATSKAGIEGLAKSLAAELVGNKIRVNVIAPSLTDTPLAAQLLSNDAKREASAKRHPIARVGTSQELANSAAFLLSADASWITGQILNIDGGLSSVKPL